MKIIVNNNNKDKDTEGREGENQEKMSVEFNITIMAALRSARGGMDEVMMAL